MESMKKPNKKERHKRRVDCERNAKEKIKLLFSGKATETQKKEMRNAVLSGNCPLCGKSGPGFKNIALHVYNMHGIIRRQLSDFIGFTFTETICSKELSEIQSFYADGRNPRLKVKPKATGSKSIKGKETFRKNRGIGFLLMPKEVLREFGRKAGLARKGCDPWNKTHKHGTRAMHRQGCRCEKCVAAFRSYWVEYNKKRKKQGT